MILITGVAGFIGSHLAKRLLSDGYKVIGIDNLNDYYDINLKNDRLRFINSSNFRFYKEDLINKEKIIEIFKENKPGVVINLAAQAGVRYSLENPNAYIDSNIVGFLNILEATREINVKHLIYASSSSVYGANKKIPFSVHDRVDNPVSLYAVTKKSNELMAYSYSHLFGIPTTGLRFFTVYGPWGRPDMAYFSFVKSILEGRQINIFNNGEMSRDFTYIDDIIECITRLIQKPPRLINNEPPYQLFNVGNNNPVKLMDFLQTLEKLTRREAEIIYKPMQDGDVKETYADISELIEFIDCKPEVDIEDGLREFVQWYKEYYKDI